MKQYVTPWYTPVEPLAPKRLLAAICGNERIERQADETEDDWLLRAEAFAQRHLSAWIKGERQ
jgi:hypothetical protein